MVFIKQKYKINGKMKMFKMYLCVCVHTAHMCVQVHAENRGRHQKLSSLSQSHKSESLTELEAHCFNQAGWPKPPESTCAHSSDVLTAFLPGHSEFELRSSDLHIPALLPTEPSLPLSQVSFLYDTNYLSQHKK